MAGSAPAATIANPLGTSFTGTNWGPVTWWVVDTTFEITCNATLDGTPPPATVVVVPNTLGGWPGRMAQYRPTLSACVLRFGGIPFPAIATPNCDWAHAVDVCTGGPTPSQLRLQIGLACPNPSPAVQTVAPSLGCTVNIAQQQLVGGLGENTPTGMPPTGMRVVHSHVSAVARTVTGCPGTSTERLQIGLGCPNPLNAVTINIPGAGCTIALHQQPLIHNGANINVLCQNTPAPPAAPTGLRITHNIANAISRTAGPGCPSAIRSRSRT